MTRRRFSREFKLEAVELVQNQSIPVSQAARDLNLQENILRNWVRPYRVDPFKVFPDAGQQESEHTEIAALNREMKKLNDQQCRKFLSSSNPW